MKIRHLLVICASILLLSNIGETSNKLTSNDEHTIAAIAENDEVVSVTLAQWSPTSSTDRHPDTPNQSDGDSNWFPAGGVSRIRSDVALPGEANSDFKPALGYGNYKSGYFRVDGQDWMPNNDPSDYRYFRKTHANTMYWNIDNLLLNNEGNFIYEFVDFGGLYEDSSGNQIYIADVTWKYKIAQHISFTDIVYTGGFKGTSGDYFKPINNIDTSVYTYTWENFYEPISGKGYLKKDGVSYAGNVELINNNSTDQLVAICRNGPGKFEQINCEFEFGGYFKYESKIVRFEHTRVYYNSDKKPLVIMELGKITGNLVDFVRPGDANWVGWTFEAPFTIPTTNSVILYDSTPYAKYDGNNRGTFAVFSTANSNSVSFCGWEQQIDNINYKVITICGYFDDTDNNTRFEIEESHLMRTSNGWVCISDLDSFVSLGYKYQVEDSTIINDEFRLKVAADEKIGAYSSNSVSYGLEISAGGKTVKLSGANVHAESDEKKIYSMIDIGAVVSNNKLDVDFTIRGWMKHASGDIGYGFTKEKTFSVRDLVEIYYNNPETSSMVEHLYNYINA